MVNSSSSGSRWHVVAVRRQHPYELSWMLGESDAIMDRTAEIGGGMADYHFVSTWRIPAPIEQVWQEILHAERWPTWWKYVVRVDTLELGTEDGVGKRLRLLFRTRLPYTLGFDIRLTEVQPPSMLASEATGELEGTGRWLLTPEDGGTLVRYNWDVRTTRWWMNLLAPIARPAFNWNHDQLMLEGGRSLARRLGVELQLLDEDRQPTRAARWAVPAAAVVALIVLAWRRRTAPR
jgi:uncharacterized protein YndB with AHSA1/START domain